MSAVPTGKELSLRALATAASVASLVLVLASGQAHAGLLDWVYSPDFTVKLDGESVDKVKQAAHEIEDKANKDLDALIGKADEATARNLRLLQAMLKDTRDDIDRMIDKSADKLGKFEAKTFEDLAKARKDFFADVDKEFVRADELLTKGDSTITRGIGDLQRLIDQWGMKSFNPLDPGGLYRLDGHSQVFQYDGSYHFEAIGTPFGVNFDVTATVDGKHVIKTPKLLPFPNTRPIETPVSDLNYRFSETDYQLVPLDIVSSSGYQTKDLKVVLLPRFPVSYTFVEILPGGKERSRTIDLAPSLREEEGAYFRTLLSAFVKQDIDDLASLTGIESVFGYLESQHQLAGGADEKTKKTALRNSLLGPNGDAITSLAVAAHLGHLARLSGDHLPFGTTFIDLSPDARYRLEVKWFDGKPYVLTPGEANDPNKEIEIKPLGNTLRIDVRVGQR